MINIDTTDITLLLGTTFSAIITVLILKCSFKKIIYLLDFYVTDYIPSSFGKDKKDKGC